MSIDELIASGICDGVEEALSMFPVEMLDELSGEPVGGSVDEAVWFVKGGE